MRKFFNSKESQPLQREKDKRRKKYKRRLERAKVERSVKRAELKRLSNQERAALEEKAQFAHQLSKHLVSTIVFPEKPIEHDVYAMVDRAIELEKTNQKESSGMQEILENIKTKYKSKGGDN